MRPNWPRLLPDAQESILSECGHILILEQQAQMAGHYPRFCQWAGCDSKPWTPVRRNRLPPMMGR